MKNISVKWLLCTMSAAAIALICIIGMGSYLAIKKLNSAVDGTALIKAQMHADMMHDAIRAEVMGALYATAAGRASELASFEKEIAEHGESLKADLAMVSDKLKGGDLGVQASKAAVVADRYYNTAQTVLKGAASGSYNAELNSFKQDYQLLEKELGVISDKIVAESTATSLEAKEAADRAAFMIIAGVIGSILLLLPLSFFTFGRIVKPLRSISEAVDSFIKSGDVSKRVQLDRTDEIGVTVVGFNALMDAVGNLVREVLLITESLFKTCSDLTAQANHGKNSAQANNDAAASVAAAIEELSSSMQEIAMQSDAAKNFASESLSLVSQGSRDLNLTGEAIAGLAESVKESAEQIKVLEDRTRSISQITGDISGIAEQTNLLALNAAIEAARAGENGRGFAVVADEVRSLAERTTESTETIGGMIKGVQSGTHLVVQKMTDNLSLVDQGLTLTKATTDTLGAVHEQSRKSTDSVTQIAFSLQEQGAVVNELTAIVNRVAENCETGCGAAEQIVQQADGLVALADSLQQKVKRYRLN